MHELAYYRDEDVVEQYAGYAHDGLQPAERRVVDDYFTDRDARVLDLGCGTGRTTAPLADLGYDVVGVDLMESLVERAREAHPDVSFEVGDATDLSFPDGSFGYVLFAGRGIDDIPTKPARMRALLEAWRVLEPGGVFAFDVKNIVNRFLFDPRSLAEWSEQLRLVVRNLRAGTLTSRYARVEFPHGVDVEHAISPRAQRRQLEDVGFEVLDVLEHADHSRPVLLDPRPYFVARKPE